MKKVGIRLTPEQAKQLLTESKSDASRIEELIEGWQYLQAHTLRELKGKFTREELIAITDAQNGTMLQPQFQASPSAFRAHLEDFEALESGFSRHGANAEAALAKVRTLTAAQVYYLQQAIDDFWNKTNGTDLEAFVSTLL